MEETFVFEKICPKCGELNYTTEVSDYHKIHSKIIFKCKKCEEEYTHPWYGHGPANGQEPIWRELLRKPFEAMATKRMKGITSQKIYQAFDSLENEDMLIIVENNKKEKMMEYSKKEFIIGKKKKR